MALGGYTYGIEPDTMRVVFKDMPGHGDPLLSHLVASGLCVAAAVFFLFFYTDSSPAALRRATQEQGNQAQAPTQGQEQAVAMGTEVGEGLEEGERRLSGAAPTTATEQQPLSRAGTAPGFIGGLRYVAGNRMLVIFIGCYAYTSPLSGMTLMAIPLLSSDQNKGLHMNTFETGMVLLLFMAFYVLYNQLFFRRVVRRIGQKSANTAGLILVALGILGFPLVEAVVPCHTPLMWVVLTVFCAVSGIGCVGAA